MSNLTSDFWSSKLNSIQKSCKDCSSWHIPKQTVKFYYKPICVIITLWVRTHTQD